MIAKDYLTQQMTEAEYLATEVYAELKREYIDGYVYAMAGAKVSHNLIVGNVHGELRNYLKGKPCRPYMSDIRVKTGKNYYYPDVLVDCSDLDGNSTYSTSPVLIVEVLSKSTRRMDEVTKRAAYKQIISLEEYVLVEQDIAEVEVIRRATGWQSEKYLLGDSFYLKSIDLTLSVENVYERINIEDVVDWLAKKALEAAENRLQPPS
ncbi:MAG: Uma2 family endonuclease [Moraxellaceae bacterium]|nr:Uma2 family endonuclease [Moraxellaceae bacterium]